MAQVRVVILDPSGRKKTTVEVPDNVPAQRLTQALITRMGLPSVNDAGHPTGYELTYGRLGEEKQLAPDQTFAEAGIGSDDVLRLFTKATVGGVTREDGFQRINDTLERLISQLEGPKRTTAQELKEEIKEKVEPLTIPIVIRKEEKEGLDFVRADRLHHIEEYRREETQWSSISYALFGAALGIVINWVTSEPLVVSKASIIVIIVFLLLGVFAAISARRFHTRAERHKVSILYGSSQNSETPAREAGS
jgi:hypothetical protein